MKSYIKKFLMVSGVVSGICAMGNDNLGYFSQVPKEIVVEIFKYVIVIEKFSILPFSPFKIKHGFFFKKRYAAFSRSCKAFNKIAKEKAMVNYIIENSVPYTQEDNAIFLYATDWLEKKIKKNETNKNYLDNLLHFAVFHNRLNSGQFLLDCGANVNCLDYDKNTLLHIAVEFKRKEMVALLLKYNASTALENKLGRTSLDIAKQMEVLIREEPFSEIVKMLEEDELFEAFRNIFENC